MTSSGSNVGELSFYSMTKRVGKAVKRECAQPGTLTFPLEEKEKAGQQRKQHNDRLKPVCSWCFIPRCNQSCQLSVAVHIAIEQHMKIQLEVNEQMLTDVCSSFGVDPLSRCWDKVTGWRRCNVKSGSLCRLDYSKHHECKSQTIWKKKMSTSWQHETRSQLIFSWFINNHKVCFSTRVGDTSSEVKKKGLVFKCNEINESFIPHLMVINPNRLWTSEPLQKKKRCHCELTFLSEQKSLGSFIRVKEVHLKITAAMTRSSSFYAPDELVCSYEWGFLHQQPCFFTCMVDNEGPCYYSAWYPAWANLSEQPAFFLFF